MLSWLSSTSRKKENRKYTIVIHATLINYLPHIRLRVLRVSKFQCALASFVRKVVIDFAIRCYIQKCHGMYRFEWLLRISKYRNMDLHKWLPILSDRVANFSGGYMIFMNDWGKNVSRLSQKTENCYVTSNFNVYFACQKKIMRFFSRMLYTNGPYLIQLHTYVMGKRWCNLWHLQSCILTGKYAKYEYWIFSAIIYDKRWC